MPGVVLYLNIGPLIRSFSFNCDPHVQKCQRGGGRLRGPTDLFNPSQAKGQANRYASERRIEPKFFGKLTLLLGVVVVNRISGFFPLLIM